VPPASPLRPGPADVASKIPKANRLIAVRGRFEACDKPLLSEGRGREFEARRVRHKFNDLNGFCSFCVPVVSRPRACYVR
jgi:hypothetical protein